jgi:hypothetical protein
MGRSQGREIFNSTSNIEHPMGGTLNPLSRRSEAKSDQPIFNREIHERHEIFNHGPVATGASTAGEHGVTPRGGRAETGLTSR